MPVALEVGFYRHDVQSESKRLSQQEAQCSIVG